MPQKNTPPNIVFIITDQQRLDTIQANGFDYMETPHLDRLVNEGAYFENMYVTSPSCSPSRASLFTGVYPHTNGVFRNDEPWPYCWVQELADNGYRCVNVGKMHTMPIEASFGFHERHVVENKDRDHPNLPFYLDNWDKALRARKVNKPSRVSYSKQDNYEDSLGAFVWEHDEDLHADVFVGQTACWWLERYNGNEPFFLQIGLPGPHPPYDPTQEYLDKYINKDLPEPIIETTPESQPSALHALRKNHLEGGHDAIKHLKAPTKKQTHKQRAHYYANVSMIDTQVGSIIDSLEKRNVLDNTVIIFTTDHGDCLNDHGHSQKWNMYEQSVHIPAIVWSPKRIQPKQRFKELVSLMDFGPTILDLAGIKVPSWMEAKSFKGLLEGNDYTPRTHIFSEHSDDLILTDTQFMTMIREKNWKLIHFVDSDEGQLFDLDNDPQELDNLWNKIEFTNIKQELLNQILLWRIRSTRETQGFTQMLAGTS